MTKRHPTKTQEQPPVVAPAAGADPNGSSSELVLRPASLKALESLVDEIFLRLTSDNWGPIADDWFALLDEWQLLHPDKLPAEPNARGRSPDPASAAPRNHVEFALRLFAEDHSALAVHRAIYGEETVLAFIAFVDGFNAGRADSLVLILTKVYCALLERYTRARDTVRVRTGKLEEANRLQDEAKRDVEARRRQKAALDNGGRANGAAGNRRRRAAHEAIVSRLYDQYVEGHPNWPLKTMAHHIYETGQLKKKNGKPISHGTIEDMLEAIRRSRQEALAAQEERVRIPAAPARSARALG